MQSVNDVFHVMEEKMKRAVEVAGHEFAGVRTGRASPALVEGLKVDYYGSIVPVKQIAAITVPEPRQLEIKPWDKNAIQPIEKAIHEANLGLTPMNDGKVVRLNIPALTEERRHDLVKVIRQLAEQQRVAVRNIRRDSHEEIRELHKKKQISDDEKKRAEERLQKVTDEHVKRIDELAAGKEKEILTV